MHKYMRIYIHHVTHWPTTHASIHLQHFKETRLPCVRDIDSFICSMSNSFATCLGNSCAVWQGTFICNVSHSSAICRKNSFAVYQGHCLIHLQYVSFICNTSDSFAIRLIHLQYVSFICNTSHSFAIRQGNSFAACQRHWLIPVQCVTFICNMSPTHHGMRHTASKRVSPRNMPFLSFATRQGR